MRVFAAAALAAGFFLTLPANAQEDPLEGFYGDWAGAAIIPNEGPDKDLVKMRNTDLLITKPKAEKGFSVKWKTLIAHGYNPHGEERKIREMSIDFAPGGDGKFRVRRAEPPLDARTSAWAQVEGSDLVVVISRTNAKGVKREGRYLRSLVARNEMNLEYTLAENGKVVRKVTGVLRRKPEHKQKHKQE